MRFDGAEFDSILGSIFTTCIPYYMQLLSFIKDVMKTVITFYQNLNDIPYNRSLGPTVTLTIVLNYQSELWVII